METFRQAYERLIGSPAPPINNPQLAHYWNLPVSNLCEIDTPPLDPGLQERHKLYLYLLMALGWNYWNGYKDGRSGTYPWNDTPGPDDPPWLDGEYRGHNIVALAVDPLGRVVDFDFNHNALFDSSAEHAEARLVRRLYALANIGGAWGPDPYTSGPSTSSLTGFTVYTSLESCAQCSGIMALATVSQVVFMQTDPGEYLIGRILYNLTPPYFRAPLPISGSEVGLAAFDQLNAGFANFVTAVPNKPFWINTDGTKDTSPAITSYLCTSGARAIYYQGLQQFDSYLGGAPLEYPTYAPPDVPGALSNSDVLTRIGEFWVYAVNVALRGTPHRI